jgi:hypothetical protein
MINITFKNISYEDIVRRKIRIRNWNNRKSIIMFRLVRRYHIGLGM